MNELTKEDIKKSVEYLWRKRQFINHLLFYLVVEVIFFFTLFLPGILDSKYGYISLSIFTIISILYSLVFLPFIIYTINKMYYLIKNYTKFNSYEVILEDVSTSYSYRNSVYYTVHIHFEGERKNPHTNPYFSSFSRFSLEDFNKSRVIGLYDHNLDKFYVIRKV